MKKAITFTGDLTTIKITAEQAKQLGIDITLDEIQGKYKTFGPLLTTVSYNALCVSAKYGRKEGSFFDGCVEQTFYGNRTMYNVSQNGYALDGYVSIGGKKYTCFTSSNIFEIDGHLINVATIHARIK